MMTATKTLGFVYVLRRHDTRKCYVGQSVNSGRPYSHLKPGSYQYAELCGDGGVPLVEIVEHTITRGEELDAAESRWMRAMTAKGWTLVNRRGPDQQWPQASPEVSRRVGQVYGTIGGRKLAQRRRSEPAFDAWWREHAAKAGNAAMRVRRTADPEFNERMRAAESRGGVNGSALRADRRANDQAWAAREREANRLKGRVGGANGGRTTAKLQRTCVECGLGPTTPGGLGYHQARTGHTGFVTPVQEGKT